MTWRGSTDIKDRIFAALAYILPLYYLYYGFEFGAQLIEQFPILGLPSVPLRPLVPILSIPFADFIVFLVLYLAVVRNTRISHFIRYNTMQAILVDIIVFLFGLIFSVIFSGIGSNIITQTISNTIFLGTVIACFYSMVQSVLGRYAEIPAISEAAYTQVRW